MVLFGPDVAQARCREFEKRARAWPRFCRPLLECQAHNHQLCTILCRYASCLASEPRTEARIVALSLSAGSHNGIRILKLRGLEYSVDAEKDTSRRVQAKITPGYDVFVILDAVLRIHPHEICAPLPNTVFEPSPVRSFDLNTMRSADVHSGVSIRKFQKMQPGHLQSTWFPSCSVLGH